MKVISVENVSKKFILAHDKPKNLAEALRAFFQGRSREDFWALKDISFEVKQGEALGIIGHNGAGKSTMLKLLTRIMRPTKGIIRTRGRISALIEIGAGFHPEMTGRENVYLNGSILGMTKQEIDRKFDEIVAFAELEKFIDIPVKRYSSGMYARLGFAVAAHVDPEILIIDEVLSVGDTAFQRKCFDRMHQVATQGSTILFVSHNLNALRQLCTRAIVLERGIMAFAGSAADAIEYYSKGSVIRGRKFVDFTSLPRMEHLPKKREVEFCSLEILNSDDCVFVNQDRIDFKLTWKYESAVRPINLRMELRHYDDTPIATALLEDVKPQTSGNTASGLFSYDISCYAPGTYKVLLVIYEKTKYGPYHDLDAVWPAFVFTKEITGDSVFNWWNNRHWGFVRNNNLSLRN